jgi:uncharacterized metal-binding protein YceD (DUF177 family)
MNNPSPEFSRFISVTRIPPKGIEEQLEAKPAERAALAKRFGLVDLSKLKAQLTLMPGSKKTVTATGTIEADVVQQCVVTLDPIESHLAIEVDIVLIPSESGKDETQTTKEAELEDEFDFFSGGKIDLGELVSQQLGVNIDPYPRKPKATLKVMEFGKKIEKQKPFATLATAVKTKKNNDKNPHKLCHLHPSGKGTK